jgi:hypothetical protein
VSMDRPFSHMKSSEICDMIDGDLILLKDGTWEPDDDSIDCERMAVAELKARIIDAEA